MSAKLDLLSPSLEVGVVTTNLEAMSEFYGNFLGLELQADLDFPGGSQRRYALGANVVKLVTYTTTPPQPTAPGGGKAQAGIRYFSFAVKNLTLPAELSFARLEDRRKLRSTLDDLRRTAEQAAVDREQHYQRAFSLLTSQQVAEAFDITRESATVRDRYGRHTFGQSALLARRMVEAGVPFVTVNCVPWDHHGTAGRLRTEEGAKQLIPPLDVAISALVDDLVERGLYERTLVVAMGEFGRTPKMNNDGGRDHWGHTFSVMMGCGRMKMGQAIGRSDVRGEFPADRPITPQDVTSTVFHHLGIDAAPIMFTDRQGRALPLIDNGAPIRELIG